MFYLKCNKTCFNKINFYFFEINKYKYNKGI